MRIILALYPINDYGGIIPFVEDLGTGFQQLGDTVYLACIGKPTVSRAVKYKPGKLGLPLHHEKGWIFKHVFPQDDPRKWQKFANSADLVIWCISVPTKNTSTKGFSQWPEFYNLSVHQLAVSHDSNLDFHSPWLHEILPNLSGMIGVHYGALTAARQFPIRSILIPNPHDLTGLTVPDYDRMNAFLSVQNFKWNKRTHYTIQAIPYLQDTIPFIGGYGFEQRYMVGRFDRMQRKRPEYICSQETDPDLPASLVDTTIWDRAMVNGMQWLGPMSPARRDKYMRHVRCVLDMTYVIRYSKRGGIFNRAIVEGMKQGAVPVCLNYGISDNEEGENHYFKPDVNYHMVPLGLTPKQMGRTISDLCCTPRPDMIDSNLSLLQEFDCKNIAEQYIEFLTSGGKKGKERIGVRERGEGILASHFGVR